MGWFLFYFEFGTWTSTMKLYELQEKANIMLSYTEVSQLTFNKNITGEIQVNIGNFS